jgi:hypothetical protein
MSITPFLQVAITLDYQYQGGAPYSRQWWRWSLAPCNRRPTRPRNHLGAVRRANLASMPSCTPRTRTASRPPARVRREVNASTHPGAFWGVCGASAVPLALAARVRYDSAAPRRRRMHTPGGTPLHPRARRGYRSRGWCATLPALIQRLLLSCPVEPKPFHPFVKEGPL